MGSDRLGAALLLGCLALPGVPAYAAPPAKPAAKEAAPAPIPGAVQPLALDTPAARKLLAAVPALAPLAAEFTLFEAADADAALRRGSRSRDSITVWAFQPAAFAWKPAPDRELWVLSGRSGKRALVAVFERRPNGQTEHAASAVLDEPDLTIAVGFSAGSADLLWTSCYACPGEGGTIRILPDRRVDIAFR